MKSIQHISFILLWNLISFTVNAGNLYQQNGSDTIIDNVKEDDIIIDEVVKTRTLPKKEKVQYFSQVTKYGFKNLFSNYSYNPSLPYNSQVNPQAELFIQGYMKIHGERLQKMKSWGLPYFNMIENILQRYGLPHELKYIAVIESNLNSSATSIAGAGGPWQFMPYTARDYGLMVNPYVDERRDYIKSTHAAARYLLKLYRDLHDWLLVMAAYNGGPGRVYEAIRKSKSRDFWKLQFYLPEESRTYVKRFIATHYIMEGSGGVTTVVNTNDSTSVNSNDMTRTSYGGNSIFKNPYQPQSNTATVIEEEVEVLPISGKYNSLIIAKNLSMDILSFNRYNPGLDDRLATTGSAELKLPADKMQIFIANKYSILNECINVLLGSTTIPTKTVYPKPVKKSRA